MDRESVFVAGGSSGLGKDIAQILVKKGVNVTIAARRPAVLEQTREELCTFRKDDQQIIDAIPLDFTRPSDIDAAFRSQPRLPDTLYCVAGGTASEVGFITDIEPQHLESCMRNNYLTSAYAAQSILKEWARDDDDNEDEYNLPTTAARGSDKVKKRHRKIVFINSAAAFVSMPGYVAYTASKCAVRGLADTLRMEAIRLTAMSNKSKYTIHIAFPNNFISPSFELEQHRKPNLTKRIEGSNENTDSAADKGGPSFTTTKEGVQSSSRVAHIILKGVDKGEYCICEDALDNQLAWVNMIGPSPRRGWGIIDACLQVIIGIFAFPFYRWSCDKMCKEDGEAEREKREQKRAQKFGDQGVSVTIDSNGGN